MTPKFNTQGFLLCFGPEQGMSKLCLANLQLDLHVIKHVDETWCVHAEDTSN